MACQIIFFRIPRYENIDFNDVKLISSYWHWKYEQSINSKYACDNFEKWCGHSLKELPSLDAIEYYKPYFEKGNTLYGTAFVQIARWSKASQLRDWLMKNILQTMNLSVNDAYKISKIQLEQFLDVCNNVRKYGIVYVDTDDHNERIYNVNMNIAKELLPISTFPYEYNYRYAQQVVDAIKDLTEMLATTNFETHNIYWIYK